MLDKTKGYVTYVAAALLALGAIGGALADQTTWPEAINGVLAALAVAGLRRAVK